MDALPTNPVASASTQSACAPKSEQTGTKSRRFRWSKLYRHAAALVAADELTDCDIAKKLGIGRTTLHHLKRRPEFAARVQAIRECLGEVTTRYTVGRRAARLAALDKRWKEMSRIIAARAADPEMQNVPGGDTGLLVRTVKWIGRGLHARQVVQYRVDTGLLRELLRLEKQAAIECGQWGNYQDDSRPASEPVVLQIVTVPSPPPPSDVPLLASADHSATA